MMRLRARIFNQMVHNRGSALVLALLVSGLVALLAVQFGQAFVLQANRTENALLQARFSAYLKGAEMLAVSVLVNDGQEGPIDHLQQAWATQLPPFPTDDGWLEVRLIDAQGLYNINNLSVSGDYLDDLSMPPALRFSEMQKQFIRLLQSFADYPLTEAEAIAIAEAVIDWVDEDDQPAGPGGAESLYYSAEALALNPANQFVSDVSELALARHMRPELLDRLRPLLTALPTITALNINTAPAEVLRAINAGQNLEPLSTDTVTALQQYRGQAVFNNAEDLSTLPLLHDIGEHIVLNESPASGDDESGDIPSPPYGVASQYFIVYASAAIGDRSRHMTSLLFRDENGVRALSRNYGL